MHWLTCFLLFCFVLLFHKYSFCQVSPNDSPTSYYRNLIDSLHHPDSLYVYEVNSGWGRGIAYFVSYKSGKPGCGYYLAHNFLYRQLAPRNLMPKDSQNVERVITIKNKGVKEMDYLVQKINQLNIFNLPNDEKFQNECGTYSISDGADYQLWKTIGKSVKQKSYYEIYNYSKSCPYKIYYERFIRLDSLFKKFFPSEKIIIHNAIKEFKKSRTKH